MYDNGKSTISDPFHHDFHHLSEPRIAQPRLEGHESSYFHRNPVVQ
jgi:hypothetical protein